MRFLLASLLLLASFASGAQTPPDSTRGRYISRYNDRFYFWPVIKRRTLTFDVASRATPRDQLSFKPNNSFSMGVGAYLFDVSMELSVSVPIDEQNRTRYGTSEARDLSATVQGTNWGIDIFTQRYEGFYLANPSVGKSVFPIRPDVRLTNLGGNGIYVFNKNRFSLWSAYNFSERQLRANGSFLLAWTVNGVHLSADSVILSPSYQTRVKTQTNFNEVQYATFSVAPGYSYNLVWKKIFLNASLAIGPAHHWVYYSGSDRVAHYDIAINTFVDGRLALGYNSERWFGGATLVSQARAVRFEDITLSTQSSSVRLLVGYRFQEKGFLKKSWKEFFPERIRKYF